MIWAISGIVGAPMHKLIIANWKAHKLHNQVEPWLAAVGIPPADLDVVVAAPFTLLSQFSGLPAERMALGAQDVSPFPLGAYTGEVAADQLADLGVQYCLVGHSERRQYFGETNESVVAKSRLLVESGIKPVVCVYQENLTSQLTALAAIGIKDVAVVYEPPDAIGTGRNAALDEVQAARQAAQSLSTGTFLYGGSVTELNIKEYLMVCDGALVGGASLDGGQFAKLLQAASVN